ncbi:hypothetical protein AVEN_213369-1 [Araneus ventricosus]|uniref:Uncharacterized protein n=1 Tax=Araneus ventricosus TaxID=182803 RepID=A0A4Y2HND5_ARAVE|nr:hypothetical protein AVEN_213369-1 [Araneus ventricosus]
MEKWLKTGTLKRSESRTKIRTTDLAGMKITVNQQDDNHEVQRPTDCPVQVTKASQFYTEKIPSQHHWNDSTTPAAALQLIEGITLLHIKTQMESIFVREGRLRRDCYWEGSSFLYQDFKQPNPPLIVHPANFDLDDRVSIVSDPHPPAEAIYRDGSHLEGETG